MSNMFNKIFNPWLLFYFFCLLWCITEANTIPTNYYGNYRNTGCGYSGLTTVSGKCQPLFPGGVRNKCSHNNYQVCCETSHDPSKQTSGCSRSADYQSTSWCMPSWDYEIPPKECTPALCQPFRSQNVIADCYYNNYPVLCQNMMHPGTRAYLRCSNQLDIQPVETVCLPTGEWRQPLPECILESFCPPLYSSGVDVRCTYMGDDVSCRTSARPGTLATVKCKPGHQPENPPPDFTQIECLPSGRWSEDIFTCSLVAVMCDPLISTSVDIQCTYRTYSVPCDKPTQPGTRARMECKKGYFPVTSLTVTKDTLCKSDGKWQDELFTCVQVFCPPLISETHEIYCHLQGQPVSCMSEMSPGTEARVKCKSQYYPLNPEDQFDETHCTIEGKWKKSLYQCISITCPPLKSSSLDIICSQRDRIVSCDINVLPGTKAQLRCKQGYHPSDPSLVYDDNVCLADGSWQNSLYECDAIRCSSLISTTHEYYCMYKDYPVLCSEPMLPGTKVQVKCKHGYYPANPKDVFDDTICLSNGKWQKEFFKCVQDLCPPLSATHMDIFCTYNGYPVSCEKQAQPGTKAQPKCKYGYYPSEKSAVFEETICEANGKWKDTLFKCTQEFCSALESTSLDISCYFKDHMVSCSKEVQPGTVANVKCKAGYHPTSSSSVFEHTICQHNGKWQNSLYKCVQVFCNPIVAEGVELTCSYQGFPTSCTSNIRPGTRARPKCKKGFRPPASAPPSSCDDTICLANGKWEHEISSCEPVTCLGLRSSAHNISCTYDSEPTICSMPQKPTTLARIACKLGYRPEDGANAFDTNICQWDGTWQYPLFHCIEQYCKPLHSPTMNISCFLNNVTVSCNMHMKPGTIAEVTCKKGYIPALPSVAFNRTICMTNGEWQDNLYVCIVKPSIYCPPLFSSTLIISCSLDGKHVSCAGMMRPGTEAKVKCRPGFRPQIGADIYEKTVCLSGGVWMDELYSCVPDKKVLCSPLYSSTLQVSCSRGAETVFCNVPVEPGTVAHVRCLPGLVPHDPTSVYNENVCLPTGIWQRPLYSCIPAQSPCWQCRPWDGECINKRCNSCPTGGFC